MGYSQTLFPFFFDFNDILHDRDQKKRKTMYYGKCQSQQVPTGHSEILEPWTGGHVPSNF